MYLQCTDLSIYSVAYGMCVLVFLALANLCNVYSRYYIVPPLQMYVYIMMFVCHIKSSLGHSLRTSGKTILTIIAIIVLYSPIIAVILPKGVIDKSPLYRVI